MLEDESCFVPVASDQVAGFAIGRDRRGMVLEIFDDTEPKHVPIITTTLTCTEAQQLAVWLLYYAKRGP